jgi:putative endonuclease
MNLSSWYVYIIRTKKNRLYTGITTNVERRFQEHCGQKSGGAKFFRSDRPEEIIYVESCLSRSEATIKEATIKKLTRKQKEEFVLGG